MKGFNHNLILLLSFVFLSCGGGKKSTPGPIQEVISSSCVKGLPSPGASSIDTSDFNVVSNWDDTKVRKVLHAFAFGGKTTDEQIEAWGEMDPSLAIIEILNFDVYNELLAPSDTYDSLGGYESTLGCSSEIWSKNHSANVTPVSYRSRYDQTTYNSPSYTWLKLATSPGANPFRQKIGFFETNHHLVASLNLDVSNQQMFVYYDLIMDGLARGDSYQDILADAASTAAIATQYNHKENQFVDGTFEGNEDFAREYHQLFFGILGTDSYYSDFSNDDYDSYSDYHELVNIPNTARALTDIQVEWDSTIGDWSPVVSFGTDFHYTNDVEIHEAAISGITANEKVSNIADNLIENVESLENLPVYIISTLADDNIEDSTNMDKVAAVRAIWNGMSEKNLLEFLRKYAISTAFFDSTRYKYRSSVDRITTITNLLSINSEDVHGRLHDPWNLLQYDEVYPFRPRHDVFGAQSGVEASDTPEVFMQVYNWATDGYWFFSRIERSSVSGYQKDWTSKIPESNNDGQYIVEDVTSWLWNYIIGDGGANLGALEKVHLWSLLGSGKDLSLFLDEESVEIIYTETEMNSAINDSANDFYFVLNELKNSRVLLDSTSQNTKETANERIGLAIAFISATPYALVQKGVD